MRQEILEAKSIQLGLCSNPECGRPHIMLIDEHNETFAIAVIEEPAEFVRQFQSLLYEAAVMKDVGWQNDRS
jgi:hypothetical protein